MLRVRNVPGEDQSRKAQPSPTSQSSSAPPLGTLRRKDYQDHEKKKTHSNTQGFGRIIVIIAIAAVVTALTYWVTPDDNIIKQEAEHVAKEALAMEHEFEREMMDWWSQNGHQKPPVPQQDLIDSSHDTTTAGVNRWVDGESTLSSGYLLGCVSPMSNRVSIFCLEHFREAQATTKDTS